MWIGLQKPNFKSNSLKAKLYKVRRFLDIYSAGYQTSLIPFPVMGWTGNHSKFLLNVWFWSFQFQVHLYGHWTSNVVPNLDANLSEINILKEMGGCVMQKKQGFWSLEKCKIASGFQTSTLSQTNTVSVQNPDVRISAFWKIVRLLNMSGFRNPDINVQFSNVRDS